MSSSDPVKGASIFASAMSKQVGVDPIDFAKVLRFFGIKPLTGSDQASTEARFTITVCREVAGDDHDAEFSLATGIWQYAERPSNAVAKSTREASRPRRDRPEPKLSQQRALSPVFGVSSHEDWTKFLPATEHVKFLKSRDWGSTTLGSMNLWSPHLRLMVMVMLSDPRPVNLYWGPEWIAIYNEPFTVMAASRHPLMMGSTAEKALRVTWPRLSQVFNDVKVSGKAFSLSELELTVERTKDGFLEEAWYDGYFSPIPDEHGNFLGLWNSGSDITDRTISSRRSRLLQQIAGASSSQTRSPWEHIVDVCRDFERDISLLVVYRAEVLTTPQSSQCTLTLEGSLGIESGHIAAPRVADLDSGKEGFLPALRAAKAKRSVVLLNMQKDGLPDFLSTSVDWRGFGQPASHIAIIPLFPSSLIGGFLIAGLNPRRPYDSSHQIFVEDIGRAATGLLSSNYSLQQAKAREDMLTSEITVQERFIRHVAEIASVGIYLANVDGVIVWANSRFYTMCGIPERDSNSYGCSAFESFLEEDQGLARRSFLDCVDKLSLQNTELRLKRKWRPTPEDYPENCWVLVASAPNLDGEKATSVIGCVTDISHLKWAEELQIQTARMAKEAKRQQEAFLDMTSHEMRNPLNSILQCADGMSTISLRYRNSHQNDKELVEVFDNMLESARTVLFCAAHQKRIIDDVLTVSKLDSAMLSVTPVVVDPAAVVTQALRMFEAELLAHEITLDFVRNASYTAEGISEVMCDPSRLTQVLINLLTNSIKFTKTCQRREVHVRIGASRIVPPTDVEGLQWIPSGLTRKEPESISVNEPEQALYILFEVQDTGTGISPEEMTRLFNRFAQASIKTHVTYGGSGLGLFISRELTELQGGMIGAKSTPGHGSMRKFLTAYAFLTAEHKLGTFAFYVKTRGPTSAELHLQQDASGIEQENISKKTHDTSPQGVSTRTTEETKSEYTVLLVEDNLINQKILKKQLQRSGCAVHVANHGLEALDALKTTSSWRGNNVRSIDFDVVLMDWEMPVMDGIETTKEIRKAEQDGLVTKHLPIIATTANARPQQVEKVFAAGVDDFLAKPFTVSQLLSKIKALLDTQADGNDLSVSSLDPV